MPVPGINRAVVQAVNVGRSIATTSGPCFISEDPTRPAPIRERWERQLPGVPLVVVESPYRALVGPLLAYLDVLDRAWPPDKRSRSRSSSSRSTSPAAGGSGSSTTSRPSGCGRALLGRPHTVVVNVPYRREDAESPPSGAKRGATADGPRPTRRTEPAADRRSRRWYRDGRAGPATIGRSASKRPPHEERSPFRPCPTHKEPVFQRAVLALTGGPSDAGSSASPPRPPGPTRRARRRPRRRDRLDAAARRRRRRRLGGGPASPRPRRGGGRDGQASTSSRSCSRPATSARPSSTRRPSGAPTCSSSGSPTEAPFGGDFAIGRTIPYVLKNAPCTVWVVRESRSPRREHEDRHRRLRPRRRGPGSRLRQRRPRGHRHRHSRRSAFDRLPETFGAAPSAATARTRTSCAGPGDRGRGPLPGPDRGRQPERHGGPAGGRGARRRAQVVAKINDPVRAEAYAELGIATMCRTNLMVRRDPRLRRAAGRPSRRACRPRPAVTMTTTCDLASRPARWPRTRRPEPCSSWSSAAARSATT